MPKHGQGQPGLWILPDAAATCTSKLRVIAAAVYSTLVERTTSDKWVDEHYILPPDAEKNGYGWRLSNKNVIDKEARLVGVFGGVDAELDLAKTAMRMTKDNVTADVARFERDQPMAPEAEVRTWLGLLLRRYQMALIRMSPP